MEEKFVDKLVLKLEKHFDIPRWQKNQNPLENLILTILSQNTNDKNRDIAFEQLKKELTSWEQVLTIPQKKLAAIIRPAGLANQKSETIINTLKWINETYHSLDLDFLCQMDPDKAIETFLPLKGIGIKTISVVLMFACGKDVFPVDTHVHRICKRLALVPENASAEKTHWLMQPLVPPGRSYSLHMNFLKLGRTICKARNPNCPECPLAEMCSFFKTAKKNDI